MPATLRCAALSGIVVLAAIPALAQPASGVKELLTHLAAVSVLLDYASNRTSKRAVDVASVKGKGEETISKWLRHPRADRDKRATR